MARIRVRRGERHYRSPPQRGPRSSRNPAVEISMDNAGRAGTDGGSTISMGKRIFFLPAYDNVSFIVFFFFTSEME